MRKLTYGIIQGISKIVYRRPKIYMTKEIDQTVPSIFLCNHEKNYGPIVITNYFPVAVRQWAHSELVELEESYKYVKERFFEQRINLNNRFSSFMSRIISRTLVGAIGMNNPIPIYHDGKRERQTIRESIKALVEKKNILIFSTNLNPLIRDGKLNSDFDFLGGYLLVVKKLLSQNIAPNIYPVSINKEKKAISIGEPIRPSKDNDWKSERNIIRDHILREVIQGYFNPSREVKEA